MVLDPITESPHVGCRGGALKPAPRIRRDAGSGAFDQRM